MLLIRISKPEYNESLYKNYELYMNQQMIFKNQELSIGQQDNMEGAISTIPAKISYSTDDKKTRKFLGNSRIMHKNNNAFIYCMYGVKFDVKNYDTVENKYRYLVPWKYIEPLWQGENTEMMVVKNTSVFVQKFHEAAYNMKLPHAYGKIHYDLDEKLQDINYFDVAMKDQFESVFHKVKGIYEIQNEVRFSLIGPNYSDNYKLELVNDQTLEFTLIPLKKGRSILIELPDLKFDKNNVPINFSSKILYYESNKEESDPT